MEPNPYVQRVGKDHLRVRATAASPGVTGDGTVELAPGDPGYAENLDYLTGWETAMAEDEEPTKK